MSFEILPLEIKDHIFTYLDDDANGICSQVSHDWHDLACKKALLEFVEILKTLPEKTNFTLGSYRATAFQTKISQFSIDNNAVTSKIKEVMDILFEEFSKTPLGYQMKHFQGTRARLLATLEVPIPLQRCFKENLLKYLMNFTKPSSSITICGTPSTKINSLFVSALASAMASEQDTVALSMTSCGLTDQDMAKIKFANLKFLNVSENNLSQKCKIDLENTLRDRIKTLIL